MSVLLMACALVACCVGGAVCKEPDHGDAGTLDFPGGQIVVRWYKFDTGEQYAALGIFKDYADEKGVIFFNKSQWQDFSQQFKHAVARFPYASAVMEPMGSIKGVNGNDEETLELSLGKQEAAVVLEMRILHKDDDPVVATLHYAICEQVARLIDLLNDRLRW